MEHIKIKIKFKHIVIAALVVVAAIMLKCLFGYNSATQLLVKQSPTGTMSCVDHAGFYFKGFATIYSYDRTKVKKTIEWRKVIPTCLLPIHLSHNPMRVYLYETAPVKKVTGYFVTKSVVRLEMSEPPWENAEIHPVAEKVINEGCVPLDDLKKYAGKKAVVYGLKVLYCSKFFKGPKPLEEFGLKRPPQSWCYTEVDV